LVYSNDQISHRIPAIVFKASGIIGLIGMILGIIGASSQHNGTDNTYHKNAESKAAVCIFFALFVFTTVLFLVLCLPTRFQQIPNGEKRLIVLVGLCLPFLCVRLIYALLVDFSKNQLFQGYFPNETVALCMAVIEEIIATIMVVAVGLTLRIIPKVAISRDAEEGESTSLTEFQSPGLQKQGGRPSGANVMPGGGSSNRSNSRPKRPFKAKRPFKGPISWLFFQGKDYFDERKGRQGQ
jgi:hypothetical protein